MQTPSPSVLESAKHELLSTVLRIAITLVGMCFAKMALNTLAGCFFALSGATTVRRLRCEVYAGVSSKSIAWFDLGMGMKQDGPELAEGEAGDAQGSAGLSSRFAR
jgi:hypothetical protein